MKYLLFLFCLISSSSFAQDSGGFRASAFVGAGGSQIEGDAIKGFTRFSVRTGLQVEISLNEKWFTNLGLMYSHRGSRGVVDEFFDNRYPLNYIEVPIGIGYNIQKGFIFSGIIPGYLITEKIAGIVEWNYSLLDLRERGPSQFNHLITGGVHFYF